MLAKDEETGLKISATFNLFTVSHNKEINSSAEMETWMNIIVVFVAVTFQIHTFLNKKKN